MKKTFIAFCLLCMASVSAMAQSETLKVWIDDKVTFTADGTTVTYLNLYENDGDQKYTSFNMSIMVPEGISINKVKSGREYVDDIKLSDRGTSSHTIACNMYSPTELRVICTSNKLENLYNDDADGNPLDLVWTIGLVASPKMVNGDYEVVLTKDGLVFNMEQDGTYVSSKIKEDVKCIFTITGGQITAIKQVSSEKKDGEIYDLGGRKVKTMPERGLVITNGKKYAK